MFWCSCVSPVAQEAALCTAVAASYQNLPLKWINRRRPPQYETHEQRPIKLSIVRKQGADCGVIVASEPHLILWLLTIKTEPIVIFPSKTPPPPPHRPSLCKCHFNCAAFVSSRNKADPYVNANCIFSDATSSLWAGGERCVIVSHGDTLPFCLFLLSLCTLTVFALCVSLRGHSDWSSKAIIQAGNKCDAL